MIDSKHFDKVVAAIMIIVVLLCMAGVYYSDMLVTTAENQGIAMDYESKLFDTSEIMDVHIVMDSDEWQDMIDHAIDEEYHSCNIEINGMSFQQVGIRAKGNTSLSNLVNDDTTDRYSFKLEFDHYIDGQTCCGLDKLVLNNNYADATNMKEAVVYDMYAFLDADASLYNYAKIYVNDEYWGVYLALEGVEDSFLLRNYGVSDGNLYKPESTGMQQDGEQPQMQQDGEQPQMQQNGEQPQMPQNGEQPQMQQNGEQPQMQKGNRPQMQNGEQPQMPEGEQPQMNMAGKGIRNDKMSGNGCDLNYTDDDLESYSSIWEGEVNSTSKKDHQRVVTALKNISEGNNLESYMDVDNILKYMAVHTFTVNLDSLSGNMAHNYYLYEEDGQLNILPWDYNLAWGGFSFNGQSGASETINFAIDTPFSNGISMEDREFFAALLENETYLTQYHSYLKQLCDAYINGGKLDETYNRIRGQIDSLVESDPTAFYSYDAYDAAAKMLYQVLKLRSESVSGQLAGTIPSTNDGQSSDGSALVDASNIDLSVMGTMGGGKMQNGMQRNRQ